MNEAPWQEDEWQEFGQVMNLTTSRKQYKKPLLVQPALKTSTKERAKAPLVPAAPSVDQNGTWHHPVL